MNKFGIKINDAVNGIWLPKNSASRLPGTTTTAHGGEGVHGAAYRQHVWDTLKGAKTRAEFEAGLAQIKADLSAGMVFPKK
jgi:hypothetical protein